MLSKHELEEIIKAWPDEDGNSSNPQVFDKWIFNQNQYFIDKVYIALGNDRVDSLSEKQWKLLNKALYRLKLTKSVFDITLEDIVGQYEIVTEYMSPLSVEAYVDAFKRRKKLNTLHIQELSRTQLRSRTQHNKQGDMHTQNHTRRTNE